jgi:putative FmdB family regulatory protein
MPAYDFRCTACSHVVEVRRSGSDDTLVPCPVCGGATKQVFHPVGVHFKGSGFHNTDNRKPEAPAAGEVAPAACPAAEGGGCAGCPAAE